MKISKFIFLSIAIALLVVACKDDSNTDNNGLGNITPRDPVQQARSVKRGFSFNSIYTTDVDMLGEGCCWAYNWATTTNSTIADEFDKLDMDFCPMGWGGSVNADAVRNYVVAHPKTKYLLGTNEPNLTDQANLTPTQLAVTWPSFVSLSKELNLKLISPAMNYGTLAGYSDPIKWLDEFFTKVDINDIHAIAVHCYMTNAASVKSFVEKFRKYGKPIWLTEFCVFENATDAGQKAFLIETLNYLEADPLVERYAWFMLRTGSATTASPYNQLVTKTTPTQLTELGILYNAVPSQDKNAYYVENQTIEAECYNNINSSESVGQQGLQASPTLRISTDPEGGNFDVNNLKANMWLEYQIDVPATGTYKFQLRYSVALDSEMDLLINGVNVKTLILNRSTDPSSTWITLDEDLKLNQGKQTLRLAMTKGSGAINWLRFAIP